MTIGGAISDLNNMLEADNIPIYYKPTIKKVIETIEQDTIEQRTGRWIKYSIPRCGEQHYQCTNCDYYINFGQWGELYTKEFKYCPNCGAKMEVEE